MNHGRRRRRSRVGAAAGKGGASVDTLLEHGDHAEQNQEQAGGHCHDNGNIMDFKRIKSDCDCVWSMLGMKLLVVGVGVVVAVSCKSWICNLLGREKWT